MTLLYQPIYNYELDRVFYQRKGRDSNPIRFGLTKAQVARLKELGQWDSFRYKWLVKREQYLRKHRLQCIVCGGTSRTGVYILYRRICRNCCEEILRITKGLT